MRLEVIWGVCSLRARMIYKVIHDLQPEAQVGFAHNYRSFKPATWLPLDKLAVAFFQKVYNQSFAQALKDGCFNAVIKRVRIPEAAGTQDFLGLNYYSRDLLRFDPRKLKELFTRRYYPKDADLSETGFLANVPEGIIESVRWGNQFGIPMIITENGAEDSEDTFRRRYTIEHLHQLWRVMNHNFPVKGYFHWSLVDNFEWERGWTQRFGLWGLDLETQARIRRPSVDMYAEICKTNSISAEVVEKYAPEIYSKIFPV